MLALEKENLLRVRAIIRKMTGHINEDLEQEVLLKSWENRHLYHEEGKFKAWLSALTVNLCRDYFRSSRFKAEVLQTPLDAVSDVTTSERTAEETVDMKTRQKIILKAVDSLPKKMREVIVCYEFEEMSYEETAARLHISVGTVKSRLFHARSVLSEKLAFLKGE